MYRAYINGAPKSVGKWSAIAFTITDCKDNIEYQHYELLDCKRNHSEIDMMAFTRMLEWVLENKINKIVVYTDSRHVYTSWRKSKTYSLNFNKFKIINVRLLGNTSSSKSGNGNLACV